MAQTVKLRRSATSGAVPTTSQLALGELALNTYDGKVYMKKSVGGTETIVEVGAGTGLSSSFILYEYTATSGQTSFSGSDQNSNTLAYDTGTPPKIQVFLNGILLDYTTDYTATNGTSVTLTNGAALDDLVQIAAYKSYATVTSINLQDNQKITFGDSTDLEIYHDGTRSIINDAGTGDLQFQIGGSAIFDVTTDGIVLNNLDVEADEFIGDLRGAVLFKAQAGEALSKGDVVYISGISGNTTVVMKADADDASKMPAFGVAADAATANSSIDIYTLGTLSGLDTSSFTEGDELFVSTTAGSLTNTPPTGESSAIQKIAKVTRSDNAAGSIFITGAGRTNAVPNLDEDQFFLGNASNQAVATDFSDAVEALSINNVVEDTTPQLGGDLASNGNDILFSDNDKAIFGTGSDLEIYHDGSNSRIREVGTGSLLLDAESLYLRNTAGNSYLQGINGGAVNIFYNGTVKLVTTSTGIDVTGTVTADGLTVDGSSVLTTNNVAEVLTLVRDNATANQLGISFSDGTNTRYFGKGTDNELYLATTANISTGSKIVTSGNFTGILDSTYYQSGDDISVGNITATGYLRGPSTFTIDPATHGDDTGTVVIAGNLQVDGTTTTINSTTLTVDDKLITLASGSINAAAADGAGIEVEISGATNPSITYDGTNDEWDFNKDINVTGTISSGSITSTGEIRADTQLKSDMIVGIQQTGSFIDFDDDTTEGTNGITISSLAALNLKFDTNNNDTYGFNIYGNAQSTPYLRIDNSGNVGIGTNSPSNLLHVASADSTAAHFQHTDGINSNIRISDTSDSFYLVSRDGLGSIGGVNSSSNSNLNIDLTSGNVGIGTTNPSHKLHVSGLTKLNAIVHKSGNLVITTGSGDNYIGTIETFGNGDSSGATLTIYDGHHKTTRIIYLALQNASGTNSLNYSVTGGGGTTDIDIQLKYINRSGAANKTDFYLASSGGKSYTQVYSWEAEGLIEDTGHSSTGASSIDLDDKMGIMTLSTGNVGIGTTSPTEILHVKATNGSIAIDANGSGNTASIKFINDNERSRISSNYDTGGGGRLTFHTDTTGGSLLERMRIDNAGNVAIGTTSPLATGGTAKLSVIGILSIGLSNSDMSYIRRQSTGNYAWQTYDNNNTGSIQLQPYGGNVGIGTTSPSRKLSVVGGTAGFGNGTIETIISYSDRGIFGTQSNHDLEIRTNGSEAMRIDSAGNVGIGTASPGFTSGSGLQIYNAGQANLRISSTTNNTDFAQSGADTYIINRVTSGDIKFRVNSSTELITIDGGAGSVGINQTSPSSTYKLDVGGAIRSVAAAPGLTLRETDASNQEWLLGSYGGTFAIRDVTGGTYPVYVEAATPSSTLYLDSTGNVGIGVSSPAAKFQVEEYGIDTTETSTTATTQVAIHTFAAATFRSARFTVQVTNSTDSTYHLTEILLIHDGTTPSITEYGTIFTGSAAEATFDADISSGNVRLLATPASTDSMEFKVVSHSITV